MKNILSCLIGVAVVGCSSGSSQSAPGGLANPTTPPSTPSCEGLDFTSDAENCGACGRSCHGGTCEKGECSAFEIHTADADLSSVVVHDGFVYFAHLEDTRLMRVPERGGEARELDEAPLRGTLPSRTVVFADDAYVYWLLDVWQDLNKPGVSSTLVQTFGRTPLAGGKVEILPSIGPDTIYRSVLYRSNFKAHEGGMWFYTATAEEGGELVRYDLGAQKPETKATLDVDFSWSWRSIAPAGAELLFTDLGKVRVAGASGAAAITTDGPTHEPYAVAADDTHVYAAIVNTYEPHTLARGPRSGGSFETIATFDQPATGSNKEDTDVLAVDDRAVYAFASRHNGRKLLAFSKDTWERKTLFSGDKDTPTSYVLRGGLLPEKDGLVFYSARKIVRLTTPR